MHLALTLVRVRNWQKLVVSSFMRNKIWVRRIYGAIVSTSMRMNEAWKNVRRSSTRPLALAGPGRWEFPNHYFLPCCPTNTRSWNVLFLTMRSPSTMLLCVGCCQSIINNSAPSWLYSRPEVTDSNLCTVSFITMCGHGVATGITVTTQGLV